MEISTEGTTTMSWGREDNAYGYYPTQFNHLMGRVLTIIEALGFDEKQEKAIKDVVKDALSEFAMNTFYISPEQVSQVKEANRKTGQ